MNSFFGRIKAWFFPILVVVLILVGLAYLQKKFDLQTIFLTDNGTQNGSRPKGFASAPPLTENEKINQDQLALNGAMHSGAVSDCEKILFDLDLKKRCLDQLNYSLIGNSIDPSGCEKIQDAELLHLCQNKTYLLAASQEKNPRLCEKISDDAIKAKCLESIDFNLAKATNTKEACDQIKSADYKTTCLDRYYLKETAASQNTSDCKKLSSPSLKDQCQKVITQNKAVATASQKADQTKKIIRSASEQLTLCESIQDLSQQTTCKDSIYPRLAFEEKNLTYCQKISQPALVQSCLKEEGSALDESYLRTAISQKDSTACEKISSAALKEMCLKN